MAPTTHLVTEGPTANGRLPEIARDLRQPEPEPRRAPASTPARTPRPIARLLLVAGLVAAAPSAVVLGVRWRRFAATHVATENAHLTADVVRIAPQVTGTVRRVLAEDNERVQAGQLLVVLDDASYRAAVAQRQADVQAALAQSYGAGASVALTAETGTAQELQAQGLVEQASSGIVGAQADVARSEASVRNAAAAARSAAAGVGSAAAAVTAAGATKERFGDAIQAAEAQLESSRAGVRAAQAAIEAAQAVAEKAARDARRCAGLFGEGAISEQAADQAACNERSARAQFESARQQLLAAEAVVSQKQADLNAARRQYQAADAGIAQAQAQLVVAREQAAAARAGIPQAQAQRAVSLQTVHQAEARRRQALGQLHQARTTPRQVAVSRSAQAQAAARIEQARAALEAAQIQLDQTRLYAPVSGWISKRTVERGALVEPGTPLLAIVPENRLWVVANFKETQLAAVRPGQRAEITVDGLPGRRLHGHVDSISAGTGATFALLPPENATGNFTKVVQRVPVKIVLDSNQPEKDRLRIGMSVTATIQTP